MQIDREYERSFKIEINRKVINTPFFFPAISSIKTNLKIEEYTELIQKIGYPSFLISSYDIFHADAMEKNNLIEIVSQSTDGEITTLLDSGHYEAFWYHDTEWSFENLESILDKITVDLCFSFDNVFDDTENLEQHIKDTITNTAKTAGIQKSGTTIPLIHSDPKSFPKVIHDVIEGINPEIIGVPERELGLSIFERAAMVKRIRDELDKTNQQIPLHLLGTGNPISILIYSICGADMFDGLEWCKTVAIPKTGHLFHFVQKELIDCNCTACKIKDIPYHTQTMAHNLVFYGEFVEKIQESIKNEEIDRILNDYLEQKHKEKIKKIAGLK
ncbi:MAG: hypothetical protein HXS48_24715 [Theionarchaea archaeon]|nr:hypothetical protein [Theionarchaea archaeon]